MAPTNEIITIGNYTITGYGICLALAIIACYFTVEVGIHYYKLDENITLPMVASAVIPGFIGAKLVYLIQVADENKFSMELVTGGFVIYGGIIVAVPSVYLYLKCKDVDILQYMDIGIAAIAIAQAIGRIGCLMSGCCHGEIISSSEWYAVTYNGISYFPIQIVCSALDFVNYIFLIMMKKHCKIKGVTLFSYLVTYGIGRFIIEFFRGDSERGFIGPLSTSQFISIFVTTIGVIFIIKLIKKRRKPYE